MASCLLRAALPARALHACFAQPAHCEPSSVCGGAGLDPRILAALSSQRPNLAQMALAQAQAQNEAAEQVGGLSLS